jgi:hypothetical protein
MNVQIFDEMIDLLRSINGSIDTNRTKVIQDGMALCEIIATAKKEAQETEDALLYCDKIITMARNALAAAGIPDVERSDNACGRSLPLHERIERLSKLKKEGEESVEDCKRLRKILGIVDEMMTDNNCIEEGCGWSALKTGIAVEMERSKRQ